MNYIVRTQCIFCNSKLQNVHFKNDYECAVAHYVVELNITDFKKIPFNIFICNTCNTAQTKYIGNLDEIYKINHADSTGEIMSSLHNEIVNIVLKYKNNIKNIIEIGSSKGILADLILKNMDTTYNIIEPCYWGDTTNKTIIHDYYENVNDNTINANTIIISHVFEHFYEPMNILKKISSNINIEYFVLVFPDLEYYINNDVLHVLNTEHTFYIDNKFLIQILKINGFDLIDEIYHKNHSVIFVLKRNTSNIIENQIINFKNTNYSIDTFYNNIFMKIQYYNKVIHENQNKQIFIWPASIHSLYLLVFGLNTNFYGFLDNSPNKIGKLLYGTNKLIVSFNKIINENNNNVIIILNGGVFNTEIDEIIKKFTNILFIR